MADFTNPYQSGRLKKGEFHYAPFQVQFMMFLEDAGIVKVVDTDKHPSFGQGMLQPSLGLPVGLSDDAIYVIAIGGFLFALFKFIQG